MDYEFRDWDQIYADEGLALYSIFQKCLIGLYQSYISNQDNNIKYYDFVNEFFNQDLRSQKMEFFTIANIVINGTVEGGRDKDLILGLLKDKKTGVKIKSSSAKPEEFKIALMFLIDKMQELDRLKNFILV